MASQDLEKFSEKVLNDKNLRARLSEAKDEAAFVERAVALGAENGYQITAADVRERMAAVKSGEKELSPRELESIYAGFGDYSFGTSYGCSFCGEHSGTSCVQTWKATT